MIKQTLNGFSNYLDENISPDSLRVILLCLVVLSGVVVFRLLGHSPDALFREVKRPTYTIKIIDSKGNSITLYQNKNIEIANSILYVYPPQTFGCANDKNAIILGGNFVAKREN